jgi:hypothetical protein
MYEDIDTQLLSTPTSPPLHSLYNLILSIKPTMAISSVMLTQALQPLDRHHHSITSTEYGRLFSTNSRCQHLRVQDPSRLGSRTGFTPVPAFASPRSKQPTVKNAGSHPVPAFASPRSAAYGSRTLDLHPVPASA